MKLLHAAYEPAGDGPHPALIALHGWGANALDLLALAPYLADGEFLVLCPQGSLTVPLGPMGDGYGWFPLTPGTPPDPEAFEAALGDLLRFLDAAQHRYPIARDKVALLGFSQGGVMAYAMALREPKRFAALAALSTWMPPSFGPAVAGCDLGRLPVLVQHGVHDELIECARARESVDHLRPLQADVTYREYDMGHEISPESATDLSAFLVEKVISPIVLV